MEKFNFPHLHKLEFFWHKDVLCHVWLKWSSGPGEEDFWKLSMYFYVTIICPWKKAWTLIWTHLIPYNQRMLCAMFGWIWTGFSRDDFWDLWMYFQYFTIISFWYWMWPFISKKLIFHNPRLNFTEWFWRKRQKCEKFKTNNNDKWQWAKCVNMQ